MDETLLARRSVWHGLVEPGSYGKAVDRAGLQVRLLDHGFAAGVICPAAQSGAAALSLGQRHLRDGMSILPIAPDQFFIESATAPSGEALVRLFGAEATVIEQTGSRASLQLSGPNVLDVLAKGVMIDCDPRAFPPGSGRVTLLGALSIQISVDADAVFELSCMRSMAGDLWHWVETAAGQYGVAVSR
jgi:sarcosine oxidase subunit gamma